ncbi:Ig-like domain-containing protein [Clostridium guangxiense]|uniref:Ig-like domain-containing protein n=1 Tax=Clostridium guangxiense TaxID=1662055 RepID=UPI001E424390|nr:Ig-like domain-containing protein [Clostridium guangxiense]MCD2345101.1 Ig-like domain-containing protein [Clostridium guangxiense]
MNKKLISLVTMTSIMFTSVSPVFAKNFDSKQNVALNHAWTVTFNKSVDTNEAFENVYIKDSKGNKIPTRLDFNDDTTKMIVTPTDGYAPNSTYTLVVDNVADTKGDKLSDNATMQFTTANEAQQGSFDINKVYSNGSTDNASSNVQPNAIFDLELSKNIDASTIGNVTVTDKDGNKANVKVTAIGSEIDIDPNNIFWDDTKTIDLPRNAYKCNTTYTINLNGVRSTDGQDIATKTYSFETRAYKLNPTIQGICNDDYISFGSQYASELYQIPDGDGDGYFTQSLQKCHDNSGTLVLDNAYKVQQVSQITNDWNPYANLQNRNIVNLQVELRKEYKKILAKNPSYSGYNVGFREQAPQTTYDDSTGMALYQYMPNVLNSMPAYTFQLFSFYKTNINNGLFQEVYSSETTDDLKNALISNQPQVAVQMSSTTKDAQGNLSRLALYQSIYSMFGGDYANEIYDYIVQEDNAGYDSRQEFHTKPIGGITIYSNNGIFLFKY